MTVQECPDKNQLTRYWVEQLLHLYEREEVLQYARKFHGSPILGIARMRWWARYKIGPDHQISPGQVLDELEKFEGKRRPYFSECEKCGRKCA